MTRNELQLQELYDNDITLDHYPLNNIDALCVNLDNEKRICLNSNKQYSSTSEFWIIEHELSHLETNALYSLNSSARTIKKLERKANDRMILKYDLPNKILNLIKKGYEKDEIREALDLTYDVIDYVIDYLYRKEMMVNYYEK